MTLPSEMRSTEEVKQPLDFSASFQAVEGTTRGVAMRLRGDLTASPCERSDRCRRVERACPSRLRQELGRMARVKRVGTLPASKTGSIERRSVFTVRCAFLSPALPILRCVNGVSDRVVD